jgi:hypothetical protein
MQSYEKNRGYAGAADRAETTRQVILARKFISCLDTFL